MCAPGVSATGQTETIKLGRLKRRPQFLRVAKGARWAMPGLVLQGSPTPEEEREADTCRLGFTASRKVGNAVRRNRAKRRLRAAAAEIMPAKARAGMDYVLVARRETPERAWPALVQDLEAALARVNEGRPAKRGGKRREP